jgi:hypothetical protein
MFSVNNAAIQVNKKNIAWASDRSHKFSKDVYPKNFQKGALIGGGKLNESIPVYTLHCFQVFARIIFISVC